MFGLVSRFFASITQSAPVVTYDDAVDGPAGVDHDDVNHWLSMDDEWPGVTASIYFTTRRKWRTMNYSSYVILPVGKLFVIAVFIHRHDFPGQAAERLPLSSGSATG